MHNYFWIQGGKPIYRDTEGNNPSSGTGKNMPIFPIFRKTDNKFVTLGYSGKRPRYTEKNAQLHGRIGTDGNYPSSGIRRKCPSLCILKENALLRDSKGK
jgi:hypothetical protein